MPIPRSDLIGITLYGGAAHPGKCATIRGNSGLDAGDLMEIIGACAPPTRSHPCTHAPTHSHSHACAHARMRMRIMHARLLARTLVRARTVRGWTAGSGLVLSTSRRFRLAQATAANPPWQQCTLATTATAAMRSQAASRARLRSTAERLHSITVDDDDGDSSRSAVAAAV